MCEACPSYQKCWPSSGASISVTVLKAPVTAGCSFCHCHPLNDLPPPLSPGCWMDWAAGLGRSSLEEWLGAAVQVHLAMSVHWSHHWALRFGVRGMQSKDLWAFLLFEPPIALLVLKVSRNYSVAGLARWISALQILYPNPSRNVRGLVEFYKWNWVKDLIEQLNWKKMKMREWSVLRVMIIQFHEAGFSLMFPRRCSASMKVGNNKWSWSWWDVNKSQKWSLLNFRNTWLSFVNVSLKMHADVIAGRQINQSWKIQ